MSALACWWRGHLWTRWVWAVDEGDVLGLVVQAEQVRHCVVCGTEERRYAKRAH